MAGLWYILLRRRLFSLVVEQVLLYFLLSGINSKTMVLRWISEWELLRKRMERIRLKTFSDHMVAIVPFLMMESQAVFSIHSQKKISRGMYLHTSWDLGN